MKITIEQLRAIAPNAPKGADAFIPYLNQVFEKYQINTIPRAAAFIAQVAHESGSFRFTKELASGSAYEGRADLGNIQEGDGVKFKGRGLIQITGRNNYLSVGKALGVDLMATPQLLETPSFAVLSAGWYWNDRKLNEYADLPDDWRSPTKQYSPFQMITYKINGGQNGAEERLNYYQKALQILA